MKIVIDISDELYRILKRNEADIRRSHDALKLAVIDGTVLEDTPISKEVKVLIDGEQIFPQRKI